MKENKVAMRPNSSRKKKGFIASDTDCLSILTEVSMHQFTFQYRPRDHTRHFSRPDIELTHYSEYLSLQVIAMKEPNKHK
jgi:hypothetical protein